MFVLNPLHLSHQMSSLQTFDLVSVMFSSVVGFQDICNNSQPMEIVSLLNSMYTKFDSLTEKHKVYKVCPHCVDEATTTRSTRYVSCFCDGHVCVTTITSSSRRSRLRHDDHVFVTTITSSSRRSRLRHDDHVFVTTITSSSRRSRLRHDDHVFVTTITSSSRQSRLRHDDQVVLIVYMKPQHCIKWYE